MVNGDKLALVLSDFARTLLTDFPIQGILDHLVERIVGVLPVTGAGVTLITPGMATEFIAASDASALTVEELQSELGQGPCLTAFETGEPVYVPDLANDDRYPTFGPRATSAGIAAVFSFPLRHGERRLGALDLYRDTPGRLSAGDARAAMTLANVAAAYLINANARQDALRAADWFRDRSLHDALTGLPNRVLLQDRIERAAQRSKRSHAAVAVLFVDLDHFKRVNDDFGHTIGDELLVAVAQRLSMLVRPSDTLARVSGDEFIFVCEDLPNASGIESLISRIDDSFATPFNLTGVQIRASASIGIAYAGPGDVVSDHLILDADMAMYQAKRRGGGTHQMIDLRMAGAARERNELERDLREALSRDEIDLAYQPIVAISDGSVTGVEALLRWTHPDRGPISAATAITIAEQSGMITGLGEWVLRRSCLAWVAWRDQDPAKRLDLSVNVSVGQLMAPGFANTVAAVLETTGMDPSALVLEVTEGIFLQDGERAMSVLRDLRSLGTRLALDDFGTGYSSLSYLRRFPVDIVKIDQSFVADIGHDPDAATMVAAVTHLAHDLGKTVTAEGVETADQCDQIMAIGCERAQGYFFARPMTATTFATHLN